MNAGRGILTRCCLLTTKACTRCLLGDFEKAIICCAYIALQRLSCLCHNSRVNKIASLSQVIRVPPVLSITVSGSVLQRVCSCGNVCAATSARTATETAGRQGETQVPLKHSFLSEQTCKLSPRKAQRRRVM